MSSNSADGKRMAKQMTILEAVTTVVEKHLPSSKTKLENWGSIKKLSQVWAHEILSADVHDTASFGVSRDVEKLEALERAIRQIQFNFSELGPSTKRAVLMTGPGYLLNEEDWLVETLVGIEMFKVSLKMVRGEETYRTPASNKVNWRAASVAKQCRNLWAKEAVTSRWNEANQPLPLNRLYVLTLSSEEAKIAKDVQARFDEEVAQATPKSTHSDRPGPFGRFVEEVFTSLGILSPEGEPIRAASALNALKKIERQ